MLDMCSIGVGCMFFVCYLSVTFHCRFAFCVLVVGGGVVMQICHFMTDGNVKDSVLDTITHSLCNYLDTWQ